MFGDFTAVFLSTAWHPKSHLSTDFGPFCQLLGFCLEVFVIGSFHGWYPIGSMYGIFSYMNGWFLGLNVGKYADFMDPMGKLVLMASLNSQHHIEQKNFAKHPQPKFIPLLLHHACTESVWPAFFEPDFLQHLQLEQGTRKITMTLIRRTFFLHDSDRTITWQNVSMLRTLYEKKTARQVKFGSFPKNQRNPGVKQSQTKDQSQTLNVW